MPKDEVIKTLAIYFTGPEVAVQSMALQLPAGIRSRSARSFFDTREALGIRGYDDQANAEAAIRAALS